MQSRGGKLVHQGESTEKHEGEYKARS
jgi:hypothetical protein